MGRPCHTDPLDSCSGTESGWGIRKKAEALIRGKQAEELAVAYLRKLCYEILEINWRIGKKEVDIIARWKCQLIFIEVKSRKWEHSGFPEAAVNEKKIKNLTYAAGRYAEEIAFTGELRFDIISITFYPKVQIYHIEDAFFSGWD